MIKNLSMMSLICGIFKNYINKLIYNTETDSKTQMCIAEFETQRERERVG